MATLGCVAHAATPPPLRVARWVARNLDGDARPERIELLAGVRPNPYGGTRPIPVHQLRISDPPRHAAVSPRLENLPGFRVGDFTGDGAQDIYWEGWDG